MSILDSERWRALRDFVGRWYREPLQVEDPEDVAEQFAAAQERLGGSLPAALSEWFQLAGARLCPYQDDFVELEELRLQQGAVPLLSESQGSWFFGISLDAEEDDPPVLFVEGSSEGGSEAFPTLSEFCLFAVRWQTTIYAALERQFVEDEELEEDLEAPLGQVAAGVRGREVDTEDPRFPDEGLKLLHTASLFPNWIQLYGSDEQLVAYHLDGSDPPELEGTLIAVRTAVAEGRVDEILCKSFLARDAAETAAREAKELEQSAEREALGLGDDQALLARLEGIEGSLLRFERSLLVDLRQAIALGTLRPGQRARAVELCKRAR